MIDVYHGGIVNGCQPPQTWLTRSFLIMWLVLRSRCVYYYYYYRYVLSVPGRILSIGEEAMAPII